MTAVEQRIRKGLVCSAFAVSSQQEFPSPGVGREPVPPQQQHTVAVDNDHTGEESQDVVFEAEPTGNLHVIKVYVDPLRGEDTPAAMDHPLSWS